MKNKVFTFLCFCTLFALGIGASGCNKIFIPDVVGTWGKPNLAYFRLIADEYVMNEHYMLADKIIKTFNGLGYDLNELVETRDYPKTIRINADNTFTFTHKSGTTSSGTYEQERQSIYFKDAVSLDGFYGEADDTVLVLYLSKSYINQAKDPFFFYLMALFNLDEDEQVIFQKMITGYEMQMAYQRTVD